MPSIAAPRAELRQPISRRRELALQFAVLVGLAASAALLLLVGAYLHRGDAARGRREAALQFRRVLQPDEHVLARAEVVQRHWWDHFRATPGVLAATDRRLLFVGAVPPALFHRGADPPSFLVQSFPYDTALSAHATRVFGGTRRGVVVRTGDDRLTFALHAGGRASADSVVRLVEGHRSARLAEIRRQRFVFDSIAALPPPPPEVHHVVPGETLYGLARQYNVTPEVLKAMNGLTEDRIRIGQDLVVRRFRRINGAVVEYYGPPAE